MIAVDEYINFIVDNKLNEKQFLVLVLLREQRRDLIAKYKQAFPTEDGTMIGVKLINDLVAKGFLVLKDKQFNLSDKFLDLYITPEVAVDEFYDKYPSFLTNDKGVSIPLNSMDRSIFKEIYIPKIMGSVKEHNEVIKDIQYGIDADLIKVGISKFLTSEGWKSLRKLRQPETRTNKTERTPTDDDF